LKTNKHTTSLKNTHTLQSKRSNNSDAISIIKTTYPDTNKYGNASGYYKTSFKKKLNANQNNSISKNSISVYQ